VRSRVPLLLPLTLLFLFGCEEDSEPPVDPPPFSLEISVFDGVGGAIQGVEAYLHIPLPGLGPDKVRRPATIFRFALADQRGVRFDILDLQGNVVRALYQGELAAGQHELVWNGTDDGETVFRGTRVFEARLQVFAGETLLYQDSIHPVLYTGVDAEQQPLLGVTDASGTIVIEDRELFPMLDAPIDLPVTNEAGESLGTFSIGDEVEIRFVDPSTQETKVVVAEIVDGRNETGVQMGPVPAPDGSATVPAILPPVTPKDVPDVPEPPEGFALHPNFPNPFN